MVSMVATVLLWQAHALAGTAGLAVFGTALTAVGATAIGYRRAPQLTGTLTSTVAATSLVMITATAMDPLWMLVGVDEIALIYTALFVVIALCAWIMPSTGVHRGWTTVVGQATVAATLPLTVWATGTSWRGLVVVAGAAAALLVVGLRIRKVPRQARARGWRRAVRGVVMALVAAVLAMSAAIASSGQASAVSLDPREWMGAARDAMVCSVTSPNLSPEPVGTGPESLISNINFGGAEQPGLGAAEQPPQYADVATNFTRAGQEENYSLGSYTLYEVAGLRGLKWVNWQKTPDGDDACGFGPWTSVMVGNLLFKITVYGLQTTLAFKEWAQVENPLAMLYDKANPIVAEVFTKFVMPMGGVMFTLAGVAIGVRATRTTGLREGLGDAAGSLLVLALAAFAYTGVTAASFTNPNGNGFYMTAEFLDTTAAGLNNAFAEAVFSMIDGNDTTMCQRPAGGGGDISPVAPGQRITSCILAESLAYKPWAIGQFGVAGANPIPTSTQPTRFSNPLVDAEPAMDQGSGGANEAGLPCYNNVPDHNGIGCGDLRSYLIAQEGGPSISARVSACVSGGAGADTGDEEADYEVLARCEPYHAVAADLYQQAESGGGMHPSKAADIIGAYQGQGSFPHVAQAFASMIGVVVTGVGLGSMGVITLLWHAWLWALFVMGLFQLLWGAYPGKSKVAVQWATNVLSTFAQRLLYGFAMTLMIWVISVVFSMQINTGIKILWTILVLIASWMMIQKIQNAAADKAPNMARYGKAAGAAPAAAAGIVGYKGLSAGVKYTGRKAAVAGGAAARGTARATRAGTIGGGKVAVRGARWAGSAGSEFAQPALDKSVAKTEAARARIGEGQGTLVDRARVKASDASGVAQEVGARARYAGQRTGNVVSGAAGRARDAMGQSASAQLRGVKGARTTLHESRQGQRAEQKEYEMLRRETRQEDREMLRRERAKRARDREKALRYAKEDFGMGAPINRPGRGGRI
ncbi:hypothetical protein [Dietzia sp. 179-F 9C3 NHS]|uniref:hypothetical protein n=1 Tax=Dietzia sp. 179-F 9C3 NHS TaxID=3374295 RepID=UPI003879C900